MSDAKRSQDDNVVNIAVAMSIVPGTISALFKSSWVIAAVGVVTFSIWGILGFSGKMSRPKRLWIVVPGMVTMTIYYIFFRK